MPPLPRRRESRDRSRWEERRLDLRLRGDDGARLRAQPAPSLPRLGLGPVLDVALQQAVMERGFLDHRVGDVVERDYAEELVAFLDRQVADMVLVHELAQALERVLGVAAG